MAVIQNETPTEGGWERQNTYDEPRLSEVVEMYEEIGMEVLLVPFDPDQEPGCAECMKADPDRYKTVYTRKPPETGAAGFPNPGR
jgi:hypothetical protein